MNTPPQIDPSVLSFEYYRSSGPGGQNVNKVATAVRLRFDLRQASLPEAVKTRLARLAGSRLSEDGILIIEAQRFRTQERNQRDAVERLNRLVTRAWQPPKVRKPTMPSKAAVDRRMAEKKRRSRIKRGRGTIEE
jgi:ribosome-associated protein